VNDGTNEELARKLAAVPQLHRSTARRIIDNRPFENQDVMVERINTLATQLNEKIGKKLLPYLGVKLSSGATGRRRNADFGRELCGLLIDVPWSAWDGYENDSGFETGIVWRYGLFSRATTASRSDFRRPQIPTTCRCRGLNCSARL